MPFVYACRNAAGNLPNKFTFNLINTLDPVLGPYNQVTVFIDDEADPYFADLYSQEIGDAIYWIGFSEDHDLDSDEISDICDRIYSYVYRTQGVA